MARAPLAEPAGAAPVGAGAAAGQRAFDWKLSIPDDLQPEAEQRPATVDLHAGMADDIREILVSFGKKASTAEEVRSSATHYCISPCGGLPLSLTRARPQLCAIIEWQTQSAQNLGAECARRGYSDEQRKLLMNQARDQQIANLLMAEAADMPHEKLRAIAASHSIKQAWQGLLRIPKFRDFMSAAREPRQARREPSVPDLGAESSTGKPLTVSVVPVTPRRTRAAGGDASPRAAAVEQQQEDPGAPGSPREPPSSAAQLSQLSASTGVAPPPPSWGGWQQQQQLLTAASPTYVTLSYVFPADVVQVVYVSGESEHVAWSVPWRAIIAKRSKSGTVSLFRKPDNRYMVGVDAGQWASVKRVRQQAQASEREHLAAQLRCDASKSMYPQRSLSATHGKKGAMPVGMRRSKPSLRGRVGASELARQSLQCVREGSTPGWYFNALHAQATAESGGDGAVSTLLAMAVRFPPSQPHAPRSP